MDTALRFILLLILISGLGVLVGSGMEALGWPTWIRILILFVMGWFIAGVLWR